MVKILRDPVWQTVIMAVAAAIATAAVLVLLLTETQGSGNIPIDCIDRLSVR